MSERFPTVPIPPILPYPMPGRDQLTPSLAPWRPDPRRAALLIHDMQEYFTGFLPAGAAPTNELITNITAIRQTGIPVFYSAQPSRVSRAERGLLHDLWGPGMTNAGTSAGDVVAALAPGDGDQVVVKHRYSAFHRTDLASRLAATGRDQLVVCGIFAHIGCLLTAADAFAHDIEAFLIADATADFSLADHLLALDWAARRCAVTMTTAELLDCLRTPSADATAPPAPPATPAPVSGRSAGGGS
jgi:isochorismate hydrolase